MLALRLALIALATLALASAQQDEVLTVEVHGSGTTNPSKFLWNVFDLFNERTKHPLFLTYRAVGSSTGQTEFAGNPPDYLAPLNHFGSGDIPMSDAHYTNIVNAGRSMVHIPFVVGAVSFFHSVPTSEVPAGGLRLTPCLLAKIFQRNITSWRDPEILAVNPGMTVPATADIVVVHRVLGSSSTAGSTEYLKAACPSVWVLDTGATIDWPAETTGAQGSDGVADTILNNPYAIGYIDSFHGHDRGLAEIELQNFDGNFVNTIEANIGAAGAVAVRDNVIPADPTANFANVNLYNLPGPDTWPITLFSYFYLEANLTQHGQAGALLKAMVKFCLSDEGQQLASHFNFVQVPQEIIDYNMRTLANISIAPDAVEYTFELADTTQARVGAGEYVISGKRRSFAEFERTSTNTEIAGLKSTVARLETEIAAASVSNHDDDEHDRTEDMAAAALFFSLLSCALATIALIRQCRGAGSPVAASKVGK